MEKVWEELKKIEAQAVQIRGDTQTKAKDIANIAQQEAEGLLANSAVYAEEEGQQLYINTIQQANQNREEQLKANQKTADKLRAQAEKRMESAITKVVNAVIEDFES